MRITDFQTGFVPHARYPSRLQSESGLKIPYAPVQQFRVSDKRFYQ
jgi:hypothetical protein